jgi:hypothetical protein
VLEASRTLKERVTRELVPARAKTAAAARLLNECAKDEMRLCTELQPEVRRLCAQQHKVISTARDRLEREDPRAVALDFERQGRTAKAQLSSDEQLQKQHEELTRGSGRVQALKEQLSSLEDDIDRTRGEI